MKNVKCICKSGNKYQDCCQPFHLAIIKPATCEQLMRSRYSAFCLQLGHYLFATYHPAHRGTLTISQLSEASLDWKNLEIVATESFDDTGYVEFKAWYFHTDKLHCHHERSNFVKENGQWLYCDGIFYT